MNIKEVSKKFGISADTIRYYERIGVIPPVKRDERGYRDFTETDMNWVYFAKVLRKAGVTIEGLVDYGKLSQQGGKTLETRRQILSDQLEEINQHIKDLEEASNYLQYKVDSFYTHMAEFEQKKLQIDNDNIKNTE